MKFLIIFFINLIFNNHFVQTLLNRNESVAYKGLNSIKEDFRKIAFPVEFEINALFVSFILSLLLTLIIYFFVVKSFNFNNIIKILEVVIIKIPFIFLGTVTFTFYLLRIYNLSRGLILLYLFLYTLIISLVVFITNEELFKNFGNVKYYKIFTSLFISLLVGILIFNFSTNRNEDVASLSSEGLQTNEADLFIGKTLDELGTCFPWSGSDNFFECNQGASVTLEASFSERLTNVIEFDSKIYLLQNNGLVYDFYDNNNVFLDLTKKVGAFEDFFESGLFSIAFHPNENYLIVSYSDLDNNLVFEKYYFDNQKNISYNDSEILVKIPNSQCCHYSGNIIWSEYFKDFLISIGDMETNGYSEKINVPLLNSEPIDTTSPRGKILLLNKELSNPDKLSVSNSISTRNDIIGYGLRNPWKTYEYNGYLFVPDIGFSTQEELNVVNLNEFSIDSKPFLFGWPHYEGVIDNKVIFNEILLFDGDESLNPNNYIKKNSIFPIVYYDHNAPANFRAALIGGVVISDQNSEYFENYFFADYISTELFSYDFKNNKLYLMPLPQISGYITSIEINPRNNNSLYFTTGSGNLFRVDLP